MPVDASKMIEALETALTTNVGVLSITVDGQQIRYASRKEMVDELKMWSRKLARQEGRRPISGTIDLGGAL